MEYNKLFVIIDRISAYILLVCIILYAISGFGITKGLIDGRLANSLHLDYLGIITLIVFSIHTFWAVHLALKRWKIWNNVSKVLLASSYIIFILFFMYVGLFYSSQSLSSSTTSEAVTQSKEVEVIDEVFTAEELAEYDGLNGQPAYAAIDGLVYDLSSIFRNGEHYGYKAGLDLTAAFYQEHSADILKRFEVVGTYSK
jgi:predicted heme/steroid binding protein